VQRAIDRRFYRRKYDAARTLANFATTARDEVDLDRLYVKRAVANEGPRFKRIRPAPMGRAFRYQRRMSHIEIALEEKGGRKAEAAHAAAGQESKSGGKAKARPAGKKPGKKK